MMLLALLWLALFPSVAEAPQPCGGRPTTAAECEIVAAGLSSVVRADRSDAAPNPTLTRAALGDASHALRSASIQSRVPAVRTSVRDPVRCAMHRHNPVSSPSSAPTGVSAGARLRPDARLLVVAAHGSRPPYLPTAPPLHG